MLVPALQEFVCAAAAACLAFGCLYELYSRPTAATCMGSLAEAHELYAAHAREIGTLTHTHAPTGIEHSRPSTPETTNADVEIKHH